MSNQQALNKRMTVYYLEINVGIMEYCLPVACLPVGRADREEKSWTHPPIFPAYPAYRQAGGRQASLATPSFASLQFQSSKNTISTLK